MARHFYSVFAIVNLYPNLHFCVVRFLEQPILNFYIFRFYIKLCISLVLLVCKSLTCSTIKKSQNVMNMIAELIVTEGLQKQSFPDEIYSIDVFRTLPLVLMLNETGWKFHCYQWLFTNLRYYRQKCLDSNFAN